MPIDKLGIHPRPVVFDVQFCPYSPAHDPNSHLAAHLGGLDGVLNGVADRRGEALLISQHADLFGPNDSRVGLLQLESRQRGVDHVRKIQRLFRLLAIGLVSSFVSCLFIVSVFGISDFNQ